MPKQIHFYYKKSVNTTFIVEKGADTMLPIFSCIIIFCLWLRYELKKSSRQSESNRNSLFEREAKANSTRKKSISTLNYITISEKTILFLEINDNKIKKYQNGFNNLIDKKIVNLSGMTNTDLKMEYGVGNFAVLCEADTNFNELVRLLHNYGKRLNELDYISESVEVLEYAISIGSDMSITYKLLTEIYIAKNMSDKIKSLIQSAEQLDSLTKNSILSHLHSAIS